MVKWLVVGAVMVMALPLALILLVGASPTMRLTAAGTSGGPSALALADIPPSYLVLHLGEARTCPGLPWGVLAGIGKVESDHGRSNLPGVHSGANHAGAEGPIQFEPATFAEFAVNADHNGSPSPNDPGSTAARQTPEMSDPHTTIRPTPKREQGPAET